jgi:hypothetical protein
MFGGQQQEVKSFEPFPDLPELRNGKRQVHLLE